jgi:hypothetical protein
MSDVQALQEEGVMSLFPMAGIGARHMPRAGGRWRLCMRAACSRLKQGLPVALCLWSWSVAASACGDSAPRLEPVGEGAPGVGWVRGERGDADASNRGRVSNMLVVRDGARVWLVGSGPSRAFARSLACVVRRELGHGPTDVISPWPRPELVLGAAALPGARHWAHADVARALRTQCTRCIARLRSRLGAAARDLGADAGIVRAPSRLLHGAQGSLGPFDWWRVERTPGVPLTLWRVRAAGVVSAHGLVWAGDAPDLRDSTVASMQAATQRLQAISADARWVLGEQGAPTASHEVEQHRAYWAALDAAVQRHQAQALEETLVPRDLPGVDAARLQGTAHTLNWQRAWRQAEDAALRPPR